MEINNEIKKAIKEWKEHYDLMQILDTEICDKCHHIPLSCICIKRDAIKILLTLHKLIQD